MFNKINNCYNTKDFRKLAKKRLPSPIFHYIDGGADDEITYKRNTEAFNSCDLIPNNFLHGKSQRRTGTAGLFAGSLELVKEGNISIKQKKLYDDIYIKQNNE